MPKRNASKKEVRKGDLKKAKGGSLPVSGGGGSTGGGGGTSL